MTGDGMIRLLSYVLLIASCKKGVVFIDEIDNGIHTTAQGVLWEAIFSAAKQFNVQIIATTHSMECVQAFGKVFHDKPSILDGDISLIRIEKADEAFKAVQFDKETLQTALDSGLEIR
jgi:AAA15 family ATPase/GTPase